MSINDGLAVTSDRDQYASAADYAYAALRREIVDGRFAPGRRIREIEISTWLGISRTPVRQALSRLEVEGLLTVLPRVGMVVATLDDAAMAELYDIREVLEGAAASLAARNASPREIATLQAMVEQEAQLPPDPPVLIQHNLLFHQAIYAAAHNQFLLKSVQALHDSLALLGPTTLAVKDRPQAVAEEHRAIVEAIAARDPERAEAAAKRHIRQAGDVRRAMRRPDPAP